MSTTLLFRFFSRIAIMIKTTAKKKQNKKTPVQKICLLQRILLPSTRLSPFEFLDFYRKFFLTLLIKPWLSFYPSFFYFEKLARIFSTRLSSALYKNRLIFYARRLYDLLCSKMFISYIKLKKWLTILSKVLCHKYCKILKVRSIIFSILCLNGLHNLLYISTILRVFYTNICAY